MGQGYLALAKATDIAVAHFLNNFIELYNGIVRKKKLPNISVSGPQSLSPQSINLMSG